MIRQSPKLSPGYSEEWFMCDRSKRRHELLIRFKFWKCLYIFYNLLLTFPLSKLFIISKSVVSDIPPWTMSTLLFTIVPKGNHRYTASINFSSFSELCWKRTYSICNSLPAVLTAWVSYLILRLHLPHKPVSEIGYKFKTTQEVVHFTLFGTWNSLCGLRGFLGWGRPHREIPACKLTIAEAPPNPFCLYPRNRR